MQTGWTGYCNKVRMGCWVLQCDESRWGQCNADGTDGVLQQSQDRMLQHGSGYVASCLLQCDWLRRGIAMR